ncbi:MAG: 2-oxo acid dehydrogenase subunit E2 [Candidatus Izimaplasma sp.]|nr:2-oxo acid dehydrogenase subunit E2 [Candidatus Izimaplasma bacterium]
MYNFKFADIGEGIHEGVILEWTKEIGDTIEDGETLVIIETDKVNAEIPSPVDGTIKKLGPDVGETVNVGETLALIDDGSEDSEEDSDDQKEESDDESSKKEPDKKSTKEESDDKEEPITEGDEEESAGVVGSIEVSSDVLESSDESDGDEETTSSRVLATPVARKMAKDLDVDIQQVSGSGENGRVLKADIKKTSKEDKQKTTSDRPQAKVPDFNEERTYREKTSKLRQTIAENMTISKQTIPHTTVMDEVLVSDLVELRNEQKILAKEKGYKLTYMPFIIKALTKALDEHKVFNSSYDHTTNEIIYKNYKNIGIAVDTPDGLILPNIKDADKLGILEIAQELSTIKEKSDNKKITLDDLRDGTISITNYGVFDSTFGAPIIKYPEVAIIGIGKIKKKPVVIDDEITIEYILPLSLSVDHRVIDGGDAGRFLRTFKSYLKNPMFLLLS